MATTALTKPAAIEIFHLALLQVLPQHLPPTNYAVKGGANLRLFLDSPRRSEDIDLNFVGRVSWSLQPRMDAVLRSPALAALLATHRLRIVAVNPSKTTTTTGRWKFGMEAPGVVFNSKVEFSMRREDRPLYEFSSVSPRIAAASRMRPASANHYVARGAIEQKIAALGLRSETQVRDVFDLDYLFTRFPEAGDAADPPAYELDLARGRVCESTYADYRELVITYLDPAFVAMYDSRAEWDRIQLHVAERLDTIRKRIK
ncbi:MAG: nucleotidyl transferase AbiEii/AbiGii toxin family protein [Candidatus Limnocylindria bacterium]